MRTQICNLLFYAVIRRLPLNCWASVNERRSLSIFETCMYLKSVDKNLHLKSKGNAEKLPSWSTIETVAGKSYYLVEVATFKYLWLSNRQCPIHIKCRKYLITFEYQMFLKQKTSGRWGNVSGFDLKLLEKSFFSKICGVEKTRNVKDTTTRIWRQVARGIVRSPSNISRTTLSPPKWRKIRQPPPALLSARSFLSSPAGTSTQTAYAISSPPAAWR